MPIKSMNDRTDLKITEHRSSVENCQYQNLNILNNRQRSVCAFAIDCRITPNGKHKKGGMLLVIFVRVLLRNLPQKLQLQLKCVIPSEHITKPRDLCFH